MLLVLPLRFDSWVAAGVVAIGLHVVGVVIWLVGRFFRREEEVEEVDISNDVDLEALDQVLLEFFWLLSTAIDQLLCSSATKLGHTAYRVHHKLTTLK